MLYKDARYTNWEVYRFLKYASGWPTVATGGTASRPAAGGRLAAADGQGAAGGRPAAAGGCWQAAGGHPVAGRPAAGQGKRGNVLLL